MLRRFTECRVLLATDISVDPPATVSAVRVASLVPSTTEMVAAMRLGHRLVARTHECDHPPSIATVPVVTKDLLPPGLEPAEIDAAVARSVRDDHTIYSLDEDALLATEPDVVLTQATCAVCAVNLPTVETAVCTMPNAATVVSFDPQTLDEVISGAETIGAAIGGLRQGLALASHLKNRLEWVRRRIADLTRPRLAAIEWPDPLFAPGHWLPDVIEAAGARNVFGSSGEPSRRTDLAELLSCEPEMVLFAFCGFDLAETIDRAAPLLAAAEWEPLWQRDPIVLAIDGSGYTSRPGPRLVAAVEALAWATHRPHPDLRPGPGVIARWDGTGWADLATD